MDSSRYQLGPAFYSVQLGFQRGVRTDAKATEPEASQALDDSISTLVDGYKVGRFTRDEAAQHLAGLIEPLPGFAAQTNDSSALDLFDATKAVLRERNAARYNLPDTLR